MRAKSHYTHVSISLPLSSFFSRSDSQRFDAYTRANIHRDAGTLEMRIARTSRGLSRSTLNFIVIYLAYIVYNNKDNKAMWKTVGLNRALNFRLRAVSCKQTQIFIILT